MPVIQLTTRINAPIERVIDLARSNTVHTAAMTRYQEEVVAGVAPHLTVVMPGLAHKSVPAKLSDHG